ncbi:phosphoribosyltransferase [uncultured Winogradskyella sp.]|uniref:phosphoribosyltransferase n=1 Tax=uncultured Winogradskyella sp. TaxID=395353 RepID=UPI0026373D50|nr:phosphoribosyltransferase family protein [uncultured Winogradskyella sp.]
MKVITLHKMAFEQYCIELFSKLEDKPDAVVGILNGGGYVLEEFKKENLDKDIIYRTVKLQRASTKGFKQSSFMKNLLSLLPYSILNRARISEHQKQIKASNKNDTQNIEIDFSAFENKSINNILILDDALDSGQTMQSVVEVLSNKFPETSIKTAVLAWTNSESIIAPDYSIFKSQLVRFPWSLDYKTKRHG